MKDQNEPVYPNFDQKCGGIKTISSQLLHLHQLAWQPARFAHPLWLTKAGLKAQSYCYGNSPALDAALNRYLIHVRNFPLEPLPAVLTDQQKSDLLLESRLKKLCMALGLISLKCVEYLRIAHYRQAFHPTLNETDMRQLLGIGCPSQSAISLTPDLLPKIARQLGYGIFHSIESGNLIWRAFSILLPPLPRAIHFPQARLWLGRLERLL
ncbi:type III secretion system domain-containing protein [Candidatus Williamhamiltonella defendens]|uniref:Oxygen-regulated invasion protein OrgA n=3 Tax=Candidatus Williamhamiltonella defendens TaxID=138072 RepID=A0A2D3TB66_9ENTR|nr:type III secretion system domain-containing protein [Candidatus Hamiltonella defensa]ACQ66906.1 hypothetical protein HDEF_0133 [Candidatus Hamiltonella defensa 5AT (Acyrthosiphon pisum)]ASV32886.1 hypothetical protein CJJ18_00640 [Candidatus Hamiltonella defensa]ATW21710.1 hypothetical protein BJP44_00635 [Candidatus Hamiltonella defensa]ATW33025.1 hypothetical protein BJP43_00630 [Candidatus Hamiltonella defensa]AWK15840.1 hypothetical protein CCS40_00640 [Candidatus Hamiltonella defensa]